MKRNWVTYVVIGGIILLLVVMVVARRFFDFSFWQNFASNSMATVIGVALGIPTALWINRFVEKQTTKERVEKIIRLLKDELSYNEIEFERWDGQLERVVNEIGIISSELRVELWQAYSDGGELEWIKDVVLVSMLADTYYSIRAVRTLADRYFDSLQFGDAGNLALEVRETLMEAIEYGNKSLKNTIKKIDDTLKNQ